MSKARSRSSGSLFDSPIYRIILTLASAILAALVITFSSLMLVNISNNDLSNISTYLLWTFVFLGLMSVVMFLKKRTKVNLIKSFVLIVTNIILGIVSLLGKDNPVLFVIVIGVYCLVIVLSRIFDIIQNHSLRSIIINGLIITFLVIFAIGLFTSSSNADHIQDVLLVECIFIALVSFIEAMSIALAQLRFKVLFKIIVSTFSLEVLFGLLIVIAAFSFAFVSVEPGISSYPDALWYCFAVVTTIGFGDFAAVTPVGRILTVILGLYGIVVVAVITSVIVNYYNETSGKHDQKELKEIQKEEAKNNK